MTHQCSKFKPTNIVALGFICLDSSIQGHLLPPTNEVWDKVIFLHLSVSHSVHRGLCMNSRPVRLPGPMFLLGGLCLGVSVWGVSVQRASVQGGGLCLQESLSGRLPVQ